MMTDGPFHVDEDKALDALSFAWEGIYTISVYGREWTAHYDGAPDGEAVTAETPDDLARAVRSDFLRRQRGPVGMGPSLEPLTRVEP